MAAYTAIEWTDHTFNPWWGCTKVGPGCDHCYAETFDRRVGGDHWGAGKPRRLVKDWSGPRKWDQEAQRTGTPTWVFCASMADVFDNEVPEEWRDRLWDLVRECRHLRWQFVTKRIGNARRMLPPDWAENFGHCGLIVTVVCQADADRDVDRLLDIRARWYGVSYEPAVEGVDFSRWIPQPLPTAFRGYGESSGALPSSPTLDWIIVGGESGPKARPFNWMWADAVLHACGQRVPVFVKQLGGRPVNADGSRLTLRDSKGKDMAEWPSSIRVREMPCVEFPPLPAPLERGEGE